MSPSAIVGTWAGTAVGHGPAEYTFDADGGYTIKTRKGTTSGTYTIDGNSITGMVGEENAFVGAISGLFQQLSELPLQSGNHW